jgi:lipopolysaccharide cholinephosphotransferase
MTIEQKELKEHFLEPETRCGHYVSAETKACWKVMLDIVEEVDRICRKYNIKYFLIAGSLLGAVRHKGFIPWDDDLDIALFREDYERLRKVLPRELPSHLFMQTLTTDPEFPISHMCIRDSRTTCINEWAVAGNLRFNMGIFLDIFVLEGVPPTEKAERRSNVLRGRWLDFHKYRLLRDRKGKRRREQVKWFLYNCFWYLLGRRVIGRLHEWSFSRFRVGTSQDAECVQEPLHWGYTENKYRYLARDLQETVDTPFEYLMLKAPKNYEAVLDRTYGDWRTPVRGGGCM